MDEKETEQLVRTARFIYDHIMKKYAKLLPSAKPEVRPEKGDNGRSERRG